MAAGVWITLAGLALIFLGGCFLIGVLICNTNSAAVGPGTPSSGLTVLLYCMTFLCFSTAALLLFLGIRKLLAVGRD